jgi:hypothetical protein
MQREKRNYPKHRDTNIPNSHYFHNGIRCHSILSILKKLETRGVRVIMNYRKITSLKVIYNGSGLECGTIRMGLRTLNEVKNTGFKLMGKRESVTITMANTLRNIRSGWLANGSQTKYSATGCKRNLISRHV